VRTLSTPRAGIDRIVLNPAQTSPVRFGKTLGPSYRRVADHQLAGGAANRDHSLDRSVAHDVRRSYRRRAEYRRVSPGTAPIVDVLYRPTGRCFWLLAPYRVQLRATMDELLDVTTVESTAAGISAALLRAELDVSEVELAIDLPWSEGAASALYAALYTPWTRHHKELPDQEWWCRGDRKSATWVRLYSKNEDGLRVIRVELVLRRDALRRFGVEGVTDLRAISWREVFTSAVRFVTFVPPRGGRQCVLAQTLAKRVRASGVQATLRGQHGRRREWMRRRLRPTATQQAVEGALAAFDRDQQVSAAGRVNGASPKRLIGRRRQ
jgi:hypothetical protein